MTVKRTREILETLVIDMTDNEVQEMINSYIPIVDLLLEALKQSKYSEKPEKAYNN
ncbi:MAG: hypothetical protein V1917_04035 [Candidatus Gottesmanbacteria bacterium]